MNTPPPTGAHVAFALEYPLGYGGGVSVLVRELIRGLAPTLEVSLVSPDSPEELEAMGLRPLLKHHLQWEQGRASRARARELADTMLTWDLDLAHFHLGGNYGWGNRRPMTSPLPLLEKAGVCCVTTLHLVTTPLAGALPAELRGPLRWAAAPVAWLGKISALLATEAEIAVSQHNFRKLYQWYFPVQRRFRQLYHSRLPEEPAPALPMAQREKLMLNVGHRAARKGQHILLEAFAQMARRAPEWRLRLVGPPGDAAYEGELREAIHSHGLEERVELQGAQPITAALMQRAAVYVQPSLEEGLPLALQEALYYGCACVGTRASGIPELLEEGKTGLLVPPGEIAPLSRALLRLADDAELRERLGATGARSIAERQMSAANMVRQHAALYRELLHG